MGMSDEEAWEHLDKFEMRGFEQEKVLGAFDALNNIFKDANKYVSNEYRKIAKESLDRVTPLERVRMLIDTELGYITPDNAPILSTVNKYMADYPEGMTAGMAEQFRRTVGDLTANSAYDQKTNRMVGNRILKALDEDVFTNLGEDVHLDGRMAASRRFSLMADKMFKKIEQGQMREDTFFNANVVRSPTRRLQKLKDTLIKPDVDLLPGSEALKEGHAAWEGIKDLTYRYIIDDAIVFDDALGIPIGINPMAVSKKIKTMGMDKLVTLFGDDMAQAIKQLAIGTKMIAADPHGMTGAYTGAGVPSWLMRIVPNEGMREMAGEKARRMAVTGAMSPPPLAPSVHELAGETVRRATALPAGAIPKQRMEEK